MLIGAASEVGGNTSIKRAVGTIRHDVDPAAAHRAKSMSVAARRKHVDGRGVGRPEGRPSDDGAVRGHDVGTSGAPRPRRKSKPEVVGHCEAR